MPLHKRSPYLGPFQLGAAAIGCPELVLMAVLVFRLRCANALRDSKAIAVTVRKK